MRIAYALKAIHTSLTIYHYQYQFLISKRIQIYLVFPTKLELGSLVNLRNEMNKKYTLIVNIYASFCSRLLLIASKKLFR